MKRILALAASAVMTFSVAVGNVYAEDVEYPTESLYSHIEYSNNSGMSYDEAVKALMNGESVPVTALLSDNVGASAYSTRNKFANLLFYDQLNDVEKKFYNLFKDNFEDMMNWTDQTYEVSLSQEVEDGDDIDETFQSMLADLNLGYSISRGKEAFTGFDNPDMFWLNIEKLNIGVNGNYSSETNELTLTVTLTAKDSTYPYLSCYTSYDEVKADYDAMISQIDEIIDGVPANATDFQKLTYFNDWLVEHNTYNPYVSKGNDNSASLIAWTPVSAFVYGESEDTTKYPVCEGYAEALKILCNRAGIKNLCCVSTTHKWNIVELDGKLYYADPTWNDPTNTSSNSYYRYKYLLISSDTMAKNDKTINHDLDTNLFNQGSADIEYPTVEESEDYITSNGLTDYKVLDANGDYRLDVTDCYYRLRDIALSSKQTTKDCNGDDVIDLKDVLANIKLLVK